MKNKLLVKAVAISLHIFLNFILINYLMRYDVTSSWLRFFLFVVAIIVLLILFVLHLISFILFIKSKS